jgi:hypothetical protein
LEALGIKERMILKLVIKKWNVRTWTEFFWMRISSVVGLLLTQNIEPLYPIKGGEFFDQPRDNQLFSEFK